MLLQIATLILTAATATAQPQATPTIYTAFTPNGAAVTMVSTDPTTHDDDRIITMDESAEIYIGFERNNRDYTIYTLEADGIHEIWMYGGGTSTWSDDFAADWQTWDFPTIHNTIQF